MQQVTLPAASRGLLAAALFEAGSVPIMMMASAADRVASLQSQREGLISASQQIVDALEDGVDLSDEDTETINANTEKVTRIDAQIAALKSIVPQGQGRRTDAEVVGRGSSTNSGNAGSGPRRTVPAEPRRNAGTWDFRNFGEFAQIVRDASGPSPSASAQQRYNNAATTYGNEGTGADGGFAVPPDFRRDIIQRVMGEGSLIDMTDKLVTQSNAIVIPKDETTPWQTSNGILSYWEGEGATMVETKPQLENSILRLNKLTTLVKVTEELLDDAPLLDTYLRQKAPVKMQAKLNSAIIRGTGAGQPLGIITAATNGATVTVSAEGTQPADSIWFKNIVKMQSRLYASDQSRVVWLINQDVLPQLMQLAFDPSASSKVPVWLPANGLAGQRFSTLMGHPVMPFQACSTIGDVGDIILADMSQYMTVTKGQDIRSDVSIHLHFDQDITTYKFVMRVAGQPWWSQTITPQISSTSLGSFVVLGAR